jgi:hypothetical protein
MENNADWLASNKTWKKWTTIGVGELLSYAGIDFKKLIRYLQDDYMNERR